MKPKIDHIHVTVADIKRAEAFYDQLLPILGFDLSLKEHDTVPEHEYQIVEYHNQEFSFGIVNQRSQYEGDRVSRRRAGALHHLAFHVDSIAAGSYTHLDVYKRQRLIRPHAAESSLQYFSGSGRERPCKQRGLLWKLRPLYIRPVPDK